MKVKLLDVETCLVKARIKHPELNPDDNYNLLECTPYCLFGTTLTGAHKDDGYYLWRSPEFGVFVIPAYFCEVLDEEEPKREMRQRYLIHREYFGKFDDDVVIAVAESLTEAAFICESLNKAFEDRPYNFDFRKVAEDIDEALDYVPGESLFEPGRVLDCFCYAEYEAKKGAKLW